jgi:hypothetical protein
VGAPRRRGKESANVAAEVKVASRRDKGSFGAEPSRQYHDWHYWWAWWQMSWNQPLSFVFPGMSGLHTAKPLREVQCCPTSATDMARDEEKSCLLLTTVGRTAASVVVPPQLEDSVFGREGDMMQVLNPYIFTSWGTCQCGCSIFSVPT